MKNFFVAMFTTISLAVGCGSAPHDESEPEVSVTDSVEPQRSKQNCSGQKGCAFAACYDACVKQSADYYCLQYCQCRAYEGKSARQCQLRSPYVDL